MWTSNPLVQCRQSLVVGDKWKLSAKGEHYMKWVQLASGAEATLNGAGGADRVIAYSQTHKTPAQGFVGLKGSTYGSTWGCLLPRAIIMEKHRPNVGTPPVSELASQGPRAQVLGHGGASGGAAGRGRGTAESPFPILSVQLTSAGWMWPRSTACAAQNAADPVWLPSTQPAPHHAGSSFHTLSLRHTVV